MKYQKIKLVSEKIINYLAAVAVSVIFALYLSGRIGWFLVAAFVCAPIVSLLLTLVFIPRIYVSCEYGSLSLCKGDCCEITVRVSNDSFLFSPPIMVSMFDSPSVTCSESDFSVSVLPFAEESFSVNYKAKISGPTQIGIKSVRITDYFGIFSFSAKNADTEDFKFPVSVIPDIDDVPFRDPVLSTAADLAASADDSEDTSDSMSNFRGGFPGYDNREYIPGDPLKRINWKQSVKRGKLLVRLDDEAACSSISVVLDSFFAYSNVFAPAVIALDKFKDCDEASLEPLMAQDAAEHSLGFVRTLIMSSYSVNYFLMGKNGWENYSIADENDLSELQTELASYKFSDDKETSRFPREMLSELKGSVSVFCTPYLEDGISRLLENRDSGKGSLQTVIYASAMSPYINSGGTAEEGSS